MMLEIMIGSAAWFFVLFIFYSYGNDCLSCSFNDRHEVLADEDERFRHYRIVKNGLGEYAVEFGFSSTCETTWFRLNVELKDDKSPQGRRCEEYRASSKEEAEKKIAEEIKSDEERRRRELLSEFKPIE